MSIMHRRAAVNARRRALGNRKRKPLPLDAVAAHEREPRPLDAVPASAAALAQLAAETAPAAAPKKRRARK